MKFSDARTRNLKTQRLHQVKSAEKKLLLTHLRLLFSDEATDTFKERVEISITNVTMQNAQQTLTAENKSKTVSELNIQQDAPLIRISWSPGHNSHLKVGQNYSWLHNWDNITPRGTAPRPHNGCAFVFVCFLCYVLMIIAPADQFLHNRSSWCLCIRKLTITGSSANLRICRSSWWKILNPMYDANIKI